ncbi:helix-turn-helix transcriptional regulator [Vallitalea guaymasensis]|uniref:Helix-turn-helix transcriptional regulator n=1 Tax=Vallitalea guaymasensis TaxID=1185412 RepID=A0A8J8SE05_9FIRM|nr:helix-turn-helix transcriptional regulator [Vallitalea guaymasensis]
MKGVISLFVKRLRQLREDRGLKQKDIAKLLNITTSAYGYYEQGKRNLDMNTLKTLSDYYNVSTDYMLGRTDIPVPIETFLQDKQVDEKLNDLIEEISNSKNLKFNNKQMNTQTRNFLIKMITNTCDIAGEINSIVSDNSKK